MIHRESVELEGGLMVYLCIEGVPCHILLDFGSIINLQLILNENSPLIHFKDIKVLIYHMYSNINVCYEI